MQPRVWNTVGAFLAGGCFVTGAVYADGLLYSFEGNTVPYDPSEGWIIADPCDPPCTEAVEGGAFILRWPVPGNMTNYHRWVTQALEEPPATFWVEWRYRSNFPFGGVFWTCDGAFSVRYGGALAPTYMYGNAAISASADEVVTGLALNQYHTYRFESLDGFNYRIAVNGHLFVERFSDSPPGYHVQLWGRGGCAGDKMPNIEDAWDFVRYGTIAFGEAIVATDPPYGYLDSQAVSPFDRFTVTFDSPNYVFIDDVAVEVTGGVTPVVAATRRTDTDDSATVEIVLDRPIPANERTRFTFTDPAGSQIIDYDFREPVPPVPTVGAAGILVTAGLIGVAGVFALRRRIQNAE